jgi:hypothetical protein
MITSYVHIREFTIKKDFKSNKEKERIKIRITLKNKSVLDAFDENEKRLRRF